MKLVSRIIIILLTLTGCGFKPIYSISNYNAPVNLIIESSTGTPKKTDYIFKQALIEAFNPASSVAKYNLYLRLVKNRFDFATQNNSINTRARIELRIEYTLKDLKGEIITEGHVVSFDSYEITSSPYSSLVSDEEAGNAVAKGLANELALKLIPLMQ